MEGRKVHKFITMFKDKVAKNKTTYPTVDEYAFSSEEIEDISRRNKERIQELKQDIFSSKKIEKNKEKGMNGLIIPVYGTSLLDDVLNRNNSIESENSDECIIESVDCNILETENNIDNEEISIMEENVEKNLEEIIEKNQEENLEEENIENFIEEAIYNEEIDFEDDYVNNYYVEDDIDEDDYDDEVFSEEEIIREDDIEEVVPQNSFVHLNLEHQRIVMDKWREINSTQIDKDIIEGKDLLNHNYTITYADEAARFIHDIRKKYEIVICYLIGFNNEKKGIYDKTIFSSKMDEEWKYLSNYIKILEKIRSFRKSG